jgi:hypothetical protein
MAMNGKVTGRARCSALDRIKTSQKVGRSYQLRAGSVYKFAKSSRTKSPTEANYFLN